MLVKSVVGSVSAGKVAVIAILVGVGIRGVVSVTAVGDLPNTVNDVMHSGQVSDLELGNVHGSVGVVWATLVGLRR